MNRVSLDEAREFHHSCPVVDAHCDTLLKVGPHGGLGQRRSDTHLDLVRLSEVGVSGQFFACWISPGVSPHRSLERALELVAAFYAEAAANPDRLSPATGAPGVRRAYEAGRVAGILSIEGGEALQGNLAMLSILHRLGVRAITLTWNHRNAIADGVAESKSGGGLTSFGREVVKEMGRLGMLVDVSHLSEAGFWQVLEEADGPVVASHSNARAVCDHPRNLGDEQIRALAAKGGVMGLHLYPGFVSREKATREAVLDHADHVIGLVGPEHLGLGMDLDGMTITPEWFPDVTCLPQLTQGLFERGHGPETVRAVLGGNLLRVMDQVGMA